MPLPSDETTLAQRINGAWRFREQLAEDGRLDAHSDAAYRIANGSGDRLPGLAIDRYGHFALIHVYERSWLARLPSVQAAVLTLPHIRGIYQVDRTRAGDATRIPEGFVAGERAVNDSTIVSEDGLLYEIHFGDGPAVGLYLDQRDNRKLVAAMTAGGSLLNTFSYTCSFSLAAARQGAATLSIDLGKAPLAMAKRNFERNGLGGTDHRMLAEDVFVYLPRLARKGEQFTTVLLDPPTFARGKKGTFSTEKNYAELVALAAPLVAAGGYLVAFANTHRMSDVAWRAEVMLGLGPLSKSFREHASWLQAPDFRANPSQPGENYLKSVVLQRNLAAT